MRENAELGCGDTQRRRKKRWKWKKRTMWCSAHLCSMITSRDQEEVGICEEDISE